MCWSPPAKTAMVLNPASKAASCATVSIPRANPLITKASGTYSASSFTSLLVCSLP